MTYPLDEETKERMMAKRRLDNAIIVYFEKEFGRKLAQFERAELLNSLHTIFKIERGGEFADVSFYTNKALEFEQQVGGK